MYIMLIWHIECRPPIVKPFQYHIRTDLSVNQSLMCMVFKNVNYYYKLVTTSSLFYIINFMFILVSHIEVCNIYTRCTAYMYVKKNYCNTVHDRAPSLCILLVEEEGQSL